RQEYWQRASRSMEIKGQEVKQNADPNAAKQRAQEMKDQVKVPRLRDRHAQRRVRVTPDVARGEPPSDRRGRSPRCNRDTASTTSFRFRERRSTPRTDRQGRAGLRRRGHGKGFDDERCEGEILPAIQS